MTYLITFACYGTHLHGDPRGSVNKLQNAYRTPVLAVRETFVETERLRLEQAPYQLDLKRCGTVISAMREVCECRGWNLLAAHARTTHVHAVVDADADPERVMNDFKAYASRRLNELGYDDRSRRRWARHGSTRWLWRPEQVAAAMRYVLEEQGEPMARFSSESEPRP